MKTMKAIIYTLAALFGSTFLWHLFTPWGWLNIVQLMITGMFALAFFTGSYFSAMENDI